MRSAGDNAMTPLSMSPKRQALRQDVDEICAQRGAIVSGQADRAAMMINGYFDGSGISGSFVSRSQESKKAESSCPLISSAFATNSSVPAFPKR